MRSKEFNNGYDRVTKMVEYFILNNFSIESIKQHILVEFDNSRLLGFHIEYTAGIVEACTYYEKQLNTKLYHQNDDKAPKENYVWHFVYIHGKAESYNREKMKHIEDRQADDLFVASQPMPKIDNSKLINVSKATLYDKEVTVVLSQMYGFVRGRIVFTDDAEALEHAKNPIDWR